MGDWFVSTAVGAKPLGPFPEEQVVEMIRGGMKIAAVCRRGEAEWMGPSAYAPFATAAVPVASEAIQVTPSSSKPPQVGIGTALAVVSVRHAA